MNSINKKHFRRRMKIKVCELLQVLKEPIIKKSFEK